MATSERQGTHDRGACEAKGHELGALGLTLTELRLLKARAERAGFVVSADRVLEAAWGCGGYHRHMVAANIRRVCTRIEEEPANRRRPVTAGGFGYRTHAGGNE